MKLKVLQRALPNDSAILAKKIKNKITIYSRTTKKRPSYRIQRSMNFRHLFLCLLPEIALRISRSIFLKIIGGGMIWLLWRTLFLCFQIW